MCGIAGAFAGSGRLDPARLEAMGEALRHRGPDGEGLYIDPTGRVGLVHRRLAVIDLVTGAQPIASEDGRIVAVMNGEIYNYRDLTRELVKGRGHRFRTRSDSEVLVHLYEERGLDCVQALRGMFAFALYDAGSDLLLLGRDRLGKKPLVYARLGGTFVFASELGALVAGAGRPLTLDFAALDAFLTLGYIPAPLSIYHEARKLEPGHALIVRSGAEPVLVRTWEPRFTPRLKLARRAAVGELRERAQESVRLRLEADVPVGLFLSGGVDSSTVGAAMVREGRGPVQSFTAGFEEPEFDESEPARQVAAALGTLHHEFRIGAGSLAALDDIVERYGEPYADSSALATWWLAKETRRHLKVVLTGDGGDELFAGYDRYGLLKRLQRVAAWLPGPVRRGLHALPLSGRARRAAELLRLPEDQRSLELVAIFGHELKGRLLGGRVTPDLGEEAVLKAFGEGPRGLVERLLYTDLVTYLPGDLLVKMDVATMAHGLEARSPLLDHELVEWVLRLPAAVRLDRSRPKGLLRDAFRDSFPEGLLDRPKQGFGVPVRHWFREGLGGAVREALASERLRSLGLIDGAVALALVDEHQRGVANHQHRLWALLVLSRWLDRAPEFRWHGVAAA